MQISSFTGKLSKFAFFLFLAISSYSATYSPQKTFAASNELLNGAPVLERDPSSKNAITASEIDDLRSQIESIKPLAAELERKNSEIQKALDSISQVSLDLSGKELSLSNNIFNIFMSSLFIIGVLATVLGFGIYKAIMLKAEREFSDKIKMQSMSAAREAQARAYLEFSYTWFALYEPTFLRYLEKPSEFWNTDGTPNGTLHELRARISMASSMAQRGLNKVIENDEFPFSGSDEDPWTWKIGFRNHILFHKTADFRVQFVETNDAPDGEELELKEESRRLLSEALDQRVTDSPKQNWYETRHTGAFCLAVLGITTKDDTAFEEGRKALEELILQKRPLKRIPSSPPKEWCASIWDECSRSGIHLKVNRPTI